MYYCRERECYVAGSTEYIIPGHEGVTAFEKFGLVDTRNKPSIVWQIHNSHAFANTYDVLKIRFVSTGVAELA